MSASSMREVSKLIRVLTNAPYHCEARVTKAHHWRVTRPGHGTVTMSRTPSDHRAIENMKADIRRHLGIRL